MISILIYYTRCILEEHNISIHSDGFYVLFSVFLVVAQIMFCSFGVEIKENYIKMKCGGDDEQNYSSHPRRCADAKCL